MFSDAPDAGGTGSPGHHPTPPPSGGARAAVPRPPLSFRGWGVVAGSFAVQALCFVAVYSFPAYAEALGRDFVASEVSLSLVYGVSGAMTFATGALSGPLADRVGARWPVMLGMAVMASGFLLAAVADGFLGVLLAYGLLVGTGAGLCYVPAVAVVQRWFVAWRGLASGLATAGVGAGTALVPVSAWLFLSEGDWRSAFLAMAAVIAVCGPLAALSLARSPEAYELLPDGWPKRWPGDAARPGGFAPALEGMVLRRVIRGRRFAVLLLGGVLLSAPVSLPFADIVATARAAGLRAEDALWLLGLIGLGSVLGRVVIGAASDRLGRDRVLLGCGLGVAGMMGWWAEAASLPGFAVFALGFGLFQGGFVALLPSVMVDLYGRRSAGGLIGVLFAARALSVLLGAPCAAALAAGAGQAVPLWVAAAVALVGTALLAVATGWPRGDAGALQAGVRGTGAIKGRAAKADAARPGSASARAGRGLRSGEGRLA